MDTLIYFFFLRGSPIPAWFTLVPIVIAIVASLVSWRRRATRNAFVTVGFLIAIPLLMLHLCTASAADDGRTRLNAHFDGVINPDGVERHRLRVVGFGDTFDFWKLKHADSNDCEQIIKKFDLEPIKLNRPSSLMSRPWWWPKSAEPYSVYQGDNLYGDRIELWIPERGESIYLFKFTE